MKKMFIDCKSSDKRVRAAVVDNGTIEDILIYKKNKACETGDIFIGKVKNILPGLFVYIDIGLEKNAFLGLTDKKEASLFDENGKLRIKQGDDLLVQVIKNPNGAKGANVTTQINYGNKYAVVFDSGRTGTIGISKKIECTKERERLREIARRCLPNGVSAIIRTKCEGGSEDEIVSKVKMLIEEMETIKARAQYVRSPYMLVRKASFIGELYTDDIEQIVIDDINETNNILRELSEIGDKEVEIKVYEGQSPIFEEYFIESQIERAMNRRVWLKSGAFIVIERTEACYVIDVNTGKNINKSSYKEMVYKTNLEAACEIARQIRLRNLSGMIIVDFIDMQDDKDRKEIERVFSGELKKDRIAANLIELNILSLAVVTRKKTREPLFEILTKECCVCNGTGRVKEV